MLEKKLRSFGYALRGLQIAWREEFNFRLEVIAGTFAIVLAWIFQLPRIEWIIIVFLIGFVLAAEALNTSLEEFCDMVKSDPDPHIAKIKDLAAAAVFVSSVAALVVGLLIFLPRFLPLIAW